MVLTSVQYQHSLLRIPEVREKYSLVENFNPLVVLSSILIFAGFSKLNVKLNISKISSQTFNIYFIHAGVLTLISMVLRKVIGESNAGLIIPICVLVVFVLSYILSVIYAKFWSWIEKKFKINERVCKMLHLG